MQLLAWILIVGLAIAYAQRMLMGFHLKRYTALLALMPLLPLFLYLPWLPSSPHYRTALCVSLLWVAPSKLALLAFDAPMDPLSWLSSGYMQFSVSTLLPIRFVSSSASPSSSSNHFFLKLILLIAILNIYPLFPAMPSPFLFLLYCIHFYLGLELAFGTVTKLVEQLFSVSLCPPFDSPYLAESLSDFWARRWNLTVHRVLKSTVYKPVLLWAGKGIRLKPGVWVQALATAATFAVSGVMHEVIYLYVSKGKATGEMATFFLVHGAATVAEGTMSKHLQAMPRRVRQILTVLFLYVTASVFFMLPLHRAGIDRDAIAEYHQLQSAVVTFANDWLEHLTLTRG